MRTHMPNKKSAPSYGDRQELDASLEAAVGEILAAEEEARRIIEEAHAAVKAIQLDGAARERDMRTQAVRQSAADKLKAVAAAEERADAECARLRKQAEQAGEKLVASKQKAAAERADELYRALGGK